MNIVQLEINCTIQALDESYSHNQYASGILDG